MATTPTYTLKSELRLRWLAAGLPVKGEQEMGQISQDPEQPLQARLCSLCGDDLPDGAWGVHPECGRADREAVHRRRKSDPDRPAGWTGDGTPLSRTQLLRVWGYGNAEGELREGYVAPEITRTELDDGRVVTTIHSARPRPVPPQQQWIAPRRWSHHRQRGTTRRPNARRRRTGASSSTSSNDPGDSDGGDGPRPAARPTPASSTRYSFACLTADARGEVIA